MALRQWFLGESVETLFLPTESSDGYGNSQVSIASIVKWMAFGDSTIMARLLQQRQETQLQQDVSRALTITPQTRFSSLYSLACALESDRLVLDTPEAMILLATLKLTRACSVTAREFACEVVKLESTAPQQAWTDALSSSLDNIVGQGAVLFEVMLASPYSGNGSGTTIMVPWEPLLVATGWIRDSLTEIEATLQSANPVNADKKVASGTLLRFKQVFRLMEEAIQRFWGLPLPSLGAHLWEVGGHPAVPINTEGWELLNRLRRMVIPPWKGAYIATPSIEESLNTVTVEMFTSALPSCAEATTPFGIPALMRQKFFPGVSSSLAREWLALYTTFFWARTSEANFGKQAGDMHSTKEVVDFATLADALSNKIATYVAERQERRRQTLKEAAEAVAARDAAALLREGKPVDNESGDKNTIITSSVQVASRYELVVEEEEAAGNDSLAVLAEVQILRRMIMVREMLSSFLIVPAPHAVKSITFSMISKLHSLVESVISVALRYSFLTLVFFESCNLWLGRLRPAILTGAVMKKRC